MTIVFRLERTQTIRETLFKITNYIFHRYWYCSPLPSLSNSGQFNLLINCLFFMATNLRNCLCWENEKYMIPLCTSANELLKNHNYAESLSPKVSCIPILFNLSKRPHILLQREYYKYQILNHPRPTYL